MRASILQKGRQEEPLRPARRQRTLVKLLVLDAPRRVLPVGHHVDLGQHKGVVEHDASHGDERE